MGEVNGTERFVEDRHSKIPLILSISVHFPTPESRVKRRKPGLRQIRCIRHSEILNSSFAAGRGSGEPVEPDWLTTLRTQIDNRNDPWVVLEGLTSVEAAIAGWWEVPGVLVAEDHSWEAPVWSGLELLRKQRHEMDDLADPAAHEGVLGLAKLPNETGDVAAFMKGLELEALLVVCPRLDDPELIGTIVRGAEAFNAAGVIFGAEGMSPFEPEAVRASDSAVFKLPVRIADAGMVLRCLLTAGFQLIGLDDSEDSIPASHLPDLASRRALVLGEEDGRLGRFWRSACNLRVRGDADTVLSHLALS